MFSGFAKSRAMRAIGAGVVYLLTCQKRANFSFLCANVSINVPTWQRCVSFSTWCAKVPRRANFSIWHANMPKSVPFFQLRLPKGVPIFELFIKRMMFFKIPNIFIPNIFHIICMF